MQLFIFLLLVVHHASGVLLNNAAEVEHYIDSLIKEFQENPKDFKFSSVIHPPYPSAASARSEYFFPKVLIWSPQEHFGAQMKCPVHDNDLVPLKWTNSVSGTKDHDARLVYDIQGNVILVQRIYYCVHGRIGHKLRSTSLDVLRCLPSSIQAYFPVELFQRSGCTKSLLQYIETQVLQGVNFLKISEGLASLNFQTFCRQRQICLAAANERDETVNSSYSAFYSNPVFSFPSNDQVMNLFLETFRRKKHLYENEMERVTAAALSCDHTFKISRNIGLVREEDNKFINQFEQLFIALNENGEVLSWKLTKSTAFSEIEDILIGLKKRLGLSKLNVICVDDCCQMRNKYNDVFPDVKVKLDLFHACQRIVRTVSRVHPLHRDMLKHFTQIFREDDDQGELRLKSTPKKEKLECNLNSFLERWTNVPSSPLTTSTLSEIEHLRCHIVKGCLSDIPPGYGTERNEQLHRLLNRSLISGATRISTELAIALLTVLFHYHSKKASANTHSCNKRIKPVIPIDANEANLGTNNHGGRTSSPKLEPKSSLTSTTEKVADDHSQIVVMAEDIGDVCNKTIAVTILSSAYDLKEVLENTAKQSHNRSFDALDMLYVNKMPDILCVELNDAEEQDPTINSHMTNLERQLAGFGLEIDPIQRDGDCAFRSIIREITKRAINNPVIKNHMESLQLLTLHEDEATYALRQLFVKELTEANDIYNNFVTGSKEETLSKAQEFQKAGVFDQEIGDVVMKACSNILGIPIMLITSSQSIPYIPFFPDENVSNEPIYVAYHYYGAGHYDATSTLRAGDNPNNEETSTSETNDNVCYCGRKAKSRTVPFCTSKNEKKSRCPCVSNQQSCSPKCRCLNCVNRISTNSSKTVSSCRCGESSKNKKGIQSCADVLGKRRTKCPCYIHKQPCTGKCSCHNCGNDYGKREKQARLTTEKRSAKCTSSPSSLKRKRSTLFQKDNNINVKQGSWTLLETCILESVESFLLSTSIVPSVHNITILYNFVINSSAALSKNSPSNHKTMRQVMGKLEYSLQRQEALKKLFYGVSAI